MSEGDKIYLIASNNYDRDVDILSTDAEDIKNNFKACVSTHVEPEHY